MVRVCVVGGGTAGSEAALEASARGAEVTVVERDSKPGRPWNSWPDLIRPPPAGAEPEPLINHGELGPSAKSVVSEAKSAAPGALSTADGVLRYDLLILATGSAFEPPDFQGSRKQGVFVLDSMRRYEELGWSSGSLGRIVVAGEGGRSLEVADRLSGSGRQLRVMISSWQRGRPSPSAWDVLSEAASQRGVSLSHGRLARVVGAERAEAVVADGEVVGCDSVVFVPRRKPRVLPARVRLGPRGGVLVGRTLASSDPTIYAAGGCAELQGVVRPDVLDGEPSSSGRVAGANCTGDTLSLLPSTSAESIIFGLRWIRIRERSSPGRSAAPRALRVGRRWGRSSSCHIDFEPVSNRVVGIEMVKAAGSALIGQVPVSLERSLRSLAFAGLGSTDISLVSETARLGLGGCRRS